MMNGCSVDFGRPTEAQRNLIKWEKELVSSAMTNLWSGLGSGWSLIRSSTVWKAGFFLGTDSQVGNIFSLCWRFGADRCIGPSFSHSTDLLYSLCPVSFSTVGSRPASLKADEPTENIKKTKITFRDAGPASMTWRLEKLSCGSR